VDTIVAPAFVRSAISEFRIAEDNQHFRISDDCLLSLDRRFLIRYFGEASVLDIPREVEVICKAAFAGNVGFVSPRFADDSRLRRIEARAFQSCWLLSSISIPSRVDRIDGIAFWGCSIDEIKIIKGNRHFAFADDFLLSSDSRSLIHYCGDGLQVLIPPQIEVIGKRAFAKQSYGSHIDFQAGSQLRRIEHLAFASCEYIVTVCIPAFVDSIDGSAFSRSPIETMRIADGNRHFRVSGNFLIRTEGNSLVCCLRDHLEVALLPEIEELGARSFYNEATRVLSFGSDSKLRRIDAFVFFRCWSLHAICIPSTVESIDGSAFAECEIFEISVAEGSRHFRVSGDFLTSFDGTSIIRYFGGDSHVAIGCAIETISVGSFSFCVTVRTVEFGSPSRVRCIGCRAFEHASNLHSILIPASTESVGESSFRKCKSLGEVRIEVGSALRRIEAEAFSGCLSLASIFVPRAVGHAGLDLRGADGFDIAWYE
jgi:hypothetical protein